jgi:hypothetical protein
MKIYTNEQHQIISIDQSPEQYEHVYELEASPFPEDWSVEKILTYKYLQEGDVEKIYP